MKKLTIFALTCVLSGVFCISPVFAGPFGIDMGMSLAQVKAICKTTPEHIEDDVYIITPLKTNDLFETYAVRIDSDYGVYWIKAIGKEIHTDGYGSRLIGTFNSLVESIAKTYGEYEKIDRKEGYFGDKPDYFMYALKQGDRTLLALWGAEYRSDLPDDIVLIGVMVNAHTYLSDVGFVTLEYNFSNYDAVQAKADTVF